MVKWNDENLPISSLLLLLGHHTTATTKKKKKKDRLGTQMEGLS
jgi:hypothetical protein